MQQVVFRDCLGLLEAAWKPAHGAGLEATTLALLSGSSVVLPCFYLKKERKAQAGDQSPRQVCLLSLPQEWGQATVHQLSGLHQSQGKSVF